MAKKIQVEKEEILWKDRKHFLWFPFSFTKYYISDGRLHEQRGLLNTVSDEVLLYRIVDVQLRRTLGQRIFGTGTVILTTRVDKDHEVVLKNIKQSAAVKTMISRMVEEVRDSKKVVGKEFYGGGHGPGPDVFIHPDDVDDFDFDEGQNG